MSFNGTRKKKKFKEKNEKAHNKIKVNVVSTIYLFSHSTLTKYTKQTGQ